MANFRYSLLKTGVSSVSYLRRFKPLKYNPQTQPIKNMSGLRTVSYTHLTLPTTPYV